MVSTLEPSARQHCTEKAQRGEGRGMQAGERKARRPGVLHDSETLIQAGIWGRGLLNPGEDSDHHSQLTDGESGAQSEQIFPSLL